MVWMDGPDGGMGGRGEVGAEGWRGGWIGVRGEAAVDVRCVEVGVEVGVCPDCEGVELPALPIRGGVRWACGDVWAHRQRRRDNSGDGGGGQSGTVGVGGSAAAIMTAREA